MEHTIVHFEIPADDVGALAGFYTELFGWEIREMPGMGGYHGINTTPGKMAAVGGGMMARQSHFHQNTNYVLVEDVAAYAEKAAGLGAQVAMGKTEIPGIGWFAVLVDPQHNLVGLFEPLDKMCQAGKPPDCPT